MCNHKILSHNSSGYIVLHPKCGHIQLAFGTTLFTLTKESYDNLVFQAREQYEFHQDNEFPNHKSIPLFTETRTCSMVLSFNELKILMDMITEAKLMCEIEELLNKSMQ